MNLSKKYQLKNYVRIFILLLGVSVLLWNCEKESTEYIINDQATISIEKVKEQFKASFNKTAFSNISNKPYWESAKTFYDQRGNSYIEVPFQILHPEDIEKGTSVSFDKLVAFSDGNTITLNIVHFFGIDTKNNFVNYETITHKELYNFNGFITTYDTNKNVIDIKQFDKGTDTQQKITIKDKNSNDDLFFRADERTEEICRRGCWYWVSSGGSRQSDNIELITCTPWVCTSIAYSGGNNRSGGGGATTAGTTSTSYSTTNHEKKKKDLEEGSASIVKPHCSSFEYSKPPGANYAGCAVVGINNTFYAYSTTGVHVTTIVFDTTYFSMPMWMNNGVAATKTAEALDKAFEATEDWYSNNPHALEAQVKFHISEAVISEMKKIGGSASTTKSPFPIYNPAPFVTNLLTTGNCN